MIQEIIGRKEEQQVLQDCLDSNKPEFVAVYGRPFVAWRWAKSRVYR